MDQSRLTVLADWGFFKNIYFYKHSVDADFDLNYKYEPLQVLDLKNTQFFNKHIFLITKNRRGIWPRLGFLSRKAPPAGKTPCISKETVTGRRHLRSNENSPLSPIHTKHFGKRVWEIRILNESYAFLPAQRGLPARFYGDLFLVIISIEEHEEPCEIKAVDQSSQITHQLIHKRAWIGGKESSWGAKTRLYEEFRGRNESLRTTEGKVKRTNREREDHRSIQRSPCASQVRSLF